MRILQKRSAVAGLAAAGLVLAGGTVAIGATEQVQSCSMRADTPNSNNNAQVGRDGCSNTRTVYGYIKERRNNFPDDVVGSKTFQGGVQWVNGSCGNGVGHYYSEANSSSGAQEKSAAVANC